MKYLNYKIILDGVVLEDKVFWILLKEWVIYLKKDKSLIIKFNNTDYSNNSVLHLLWNSFKIGCWNKLIKWKEAKLVKLKILKVWRLWPLYLQVSKLYPPDWLLMALKIAENVVVEMDIWIIQELLIWDLTIYGKSPLREIKLY